MQMNTNLEPEMAYKSTEFSPIFKDNAGHDNLQLFAAMRKGGKVAFLFVVDHDEHLSASGFLTENPGVVVADYDYVITATQEQFEEVFGS